VSGYNLASSFFEHATRFPKRVALEFDDREITYGELHEIVQPIARRLTDKCGGKVGRVGILASRSVEAYAGILAACWSGGTYVPLSLKIPEARLRTMLERVELDALIVDSAGAGLLSESLLPSCPKYILAPAALDGEQRQDSTGRRHKIECRAVLEALDPTDKPVEVPASHTGYIVFTSGTTGTPKGVMIPTGAVAQHLSAMLERSDLSHKDRIAGISDVTFDLSVTDIFLTFAVGGTLLVVPGTQMMAPLKFVQKKRATVWFTVPSFIALMSRMKMLTPNALPDLRYSFFAGETLPLASALQWQRTASRSIIHCLYGPTETTIVCTGLPFTGENCVTPGRDSVPIGVPFPGTEVMILDAHLREVPVGMAGEIAIAGPQLSSGYYGDPELTAKKFPEINSKRWYLSGDHGFQDAAGVFHHLGRVDYQIKVRGHRIELEEVEAHLREVCQTGAVAAIGWPADHGVAEGIIAFVSGSANSQKSNWVAELKRRLPFYMVPSEIHQLSSLPFNVNGKVDRKELGEMLTRKAVCTPA
jgi:amino acid adenylation domain-containing protein